jgi:glutamate-1-semialdehyde 2,1-aminomutase
MTDTLADPTVERYRTLVREFLETRPVEAPQAMVESFGRMIQTASPETLTTEKVLGLVHMGRTFLAGQKARLEEGALSHTDFAGLCGQFRGGANLLVSRAVWLDATAKSALEAFVKETTEIVPPAEDRTEVPRNLPHARERVASRYSRSQDLFRQAQNLIPLASQTHRKSYHEYPGGASPLFLERAEGAQVWDVDGNAYIDYVGALMLISLGYRDPDVDAAIRTQLERGINMSLPTRLELELAEHLVELIPCAEMVRYGKNGSDATSASVRLARAATGRDHIAVCGYHGYPDWYIGSTSMNKGVPGAVRELTHHFLYNNPESLEDLLQRHPDQFAAVIMEPMMFDKPADGFLEKVRDLIHAHGGLLIFDETITGFKFNLGGAQTLFGVTPDLATFSKGMANGMPLSAVVGPRDLMKKLDNEVYYSVTFGGENLSLAAAVATVTKMRTEPVVETLWSRGAQLVAGLRRLIGRHQVADVLQLRGAPVWSHLIFLDGAGVTGPEVRALLIQEMLLRGVMVTRSHTINYALTEEQVDQTLQAYDESLAIVAEAVTAKDVRSRLVDPHVDAGVDLRRMMSGG